MPEDRLYVVIHGLISLVEQPSTDSFRALLLEMDSHGVALGHWRTERSLPKGHKLELTGVKAGGKSMDPAQNLIVKKVKVNQPALDKYLYAEITLPRPLELHSFCRSDVTQHLTG